MAATSSACLVSRLHSRTPATSRTWRNAVIDWRPTGPRPIAATVTGPGRPSSRAATAARAAVRMAVMSEESKMARTANRTGSKASTTPATPPASGRRLAFTVSTGGSARAPDFRCSEPPGNGRSADTAVADGAVASATTACWVASISSGHRSSDRTSLRLSNRTGESADCVTGPVCQVTAMAGARAGRGGPARKSAAGAAQGHQCPPAPRDGYLRPTPAHRASVPSASKPGRHC
jgi:hypothetical protein